MLYELITFLTVPLCFTFYYYLDKEKRIKINDKPYIYNVDSYKKLDLWYTYQDFKEFQIEYFNNKE
jgi:hypothetical protein